MEALKKCPFCGGQAKIKNHNFCMDMQFDSDHDSFWCECQECGAQSKAIRIDNARYRKTCKEEFKQAELEVAEAWNKRCCE